MLYRCPDMRALGAMPCVPLSHISTVFLALGHVESFIRREMINATKARKAPATSTSH